MADENFAVRVREFVRRIPAGKVMTYGQLAALAGNARAARIVGGIAHYGDPSLPWHRVVNKRGGLASGYPGGRTSHRKHLEAEGVVFVKELDESRLKIEEYLWQPEKR